MTRITEDTQEMVERIKQLRAERIRYFDVEGDGVDVVLADVQATIERQASQLAGVVGERDALRAAAMGMRQVLVRYRNETPLGHQPHMIAHVADLAIAEFDAALSPNQGAKL